MTNASCKPALAAIFAVALSAAGLAFWATPDGPGVTPDSVDYIAAANSAITGTGFRGWNNAPLTNFPIGYPLLLAGAGWLCHGVLPGARILGAAVFAANTLLVGVTTFQAANRRLFAGLCAAAFFMSCPGMLRLHLVAMSEAPCMLFSLSSVIGLCVYLSRRRFVDLLWSGLLLGAALGIRYAGIALLLPAAICIVRSGPGHLRRRLCDVVAFSLLAIAPLALIVLDNVTQSASATNRHLVFHPPAVSEVWSLIYSLRVMWLAPLPFVLPDVVKLLVILLVAGIAARVMLAPSATGGDDEKGFACRLRQWSRIFPAAYLLFIVLARSFAEADITFDVRMLSPICPYLTILAVSTASNAVRRVKGPWLGRASAVAAIVVVGINAVAAGVECARVRRDGLGYNTRKWATSECVSSAAGAVSNGMTVYSNAPEALRFLAGIAASPLPSFYDPHTLRANRAYPAEVEALCDDMARGRSAVVDFAAIDRPFFVGHAEFERRRPLATPQRLTDGTVLLMDAVRQGRPPTRAE